MQEDTKISQKSGKNNLRIQDETGRPSYHKGCIAPTARRLSNSREK